MKNNRITRPVTVPRQANQHCLIGTGLSFDGVQVALLVPASAPLPPSEYVKIFVQDFYKMWRRSKQVTLKDCYEATLHRMERLS